MVCCTPERDPPRPPCTRGEIDGWTVGWVEKHRNGTRTIVALFLVQSGLVIPKITITIFCDVGKGGAFSYFKTMIESP